MLSLRSRCHQPVRHSSEGLRCSTLYHLGEYIAQGPASPGPTLQPSVPQVASGRIENRDSNTHPQLSILALGVANVKSPVNSAHSALPLDRE